MNRRSGIGPALFAFALFGVMVACVPQAANVPVSKPTACAPADFRPTYFPWPVLHRAPVDMTVARTAILQWESRSRGATLALVTEAEPAKDIDEFPTVPVRGTEGRVVWIGDPGVGELTLQWSEGDGLCDNYALHLFDQSMSEREAEREIKKIAGGLQ